MQKDIDILYSPFFNINERRNIKDMRINYTTTGITISGKLGKTTAYRESIAFVETINLGKYIYEHQNIIETLKEAKDFVEKENIYWARLETEYPSFDKTLVKKLKSKKLDELTTKWVYACGIHKDLYTINEEEKTFIAEGYLIYKMCMNLYKIYDEFYKTNKVSFNIVYTYDRKQENKIQKDFPTLIDAFCYELLNFEKNKTRQRFLKQCEYCGVFFMGAETKLTCSQICKDKKNRKYEKRKERLTQK